MSKVPALQPFLYHTMQLISERVSSSSSDLSYLFLILTIPEFVSFVASKNMRVVDFCPSPWFWNVLSVLTVIVKTAVFYGVMK